MSRAFAVTLALLTVPAAAAAKPAHKSAVAGLLGPFLPVRLNDCKLCHQPGTAPHDDDKPRNPFGERLHGLRRELKDAGKPADIAARFDAAAGEDSDGDGASNLLEVLAGRLPGDPADTPTAAERVAAEASLAKYKTFRASYPWKPFDPLVRPPLPPVTAPAWAANPVDRFVSAAHAAHGLTPRPEADRPALVRRVTFDLTGLPPTPAEVAAFVDDPSPDAYEKLVDRLLASPRYGERWGRHWMDVWRYSDWAGWSGGNEVRDSQPHVWRWRDWIIDSVNADKPYDRMVREMLAGDEIAPADPDTLRATGYLARNFKFDREVWLQEVVDHTFLAFQAVTLKCARCHDHFYDPIRQTEYYAVRAVFQPHRVRIDRVPGAADVGKDGLARAYDADPTAPTYLLERGDERHPDTSAAIQPGVPTSYGPRFPAAKPVKLPPDDFAPDGREFVVRDDLAAAETAVAAARAVREKARAAAKQPALAVAEAGVVLATAKRDALAAAVAADRLLGAPGWEAAAKAAQAAQRAVAVAAAQRDRAAAGGDVKKRAAADAAVAKAEAEAAEPRTTAYASRPVARFPDTSTGRRTALADWLTDPANPLTARVAVNHVWLRHFGQALVPSVFDFGKNGRRPTHPALLDWLAAELRDGGWKMKPLHRLLVTSRAYRLASTPSAGGLAADRDNLHYWRFAPRRLEAEAVRDQLLAVAGRLDLTPGGPDLDHTRALEIPRRSVYFRHAHERQAEFLALFDAAAVTECYERRESVVPQQALALANGPLSARLAEGLAAELGGAAGADPAAFAAAAYRRVLGRPPTPGERAECVAYLAAAGPTPVTAATPDTPDHTDGDGTRYELGSRFRTTGTATITALKFYKAPSETGKHVGRLWTADGEVLASVEFATETAGGWQTAKLSPPVRLPAGRRYVVSVNSNTHYPTTRESRSPAPPAGPLAFEKGVYAREPGKLPASEFGAAYFVDVVTDPAGGLFAPRDAPAASDRRRAGLVLALFNHHEFVTLR